MQIISSQKKREYIRFMIKKTEPVFLTQNYPSGNLKWKVQFQNEKSDGPAINFYENGNIESELNYLEGQLHGIQVYYYENVLNTTPPSLKVFGCNSLPSRFIRIGWKNE